jgi:hypothetical protein
VRSIACSSRAGGCVDPKRTLPLAMNVETFDSGIDSQSVCSRAILTM